MKRNVRIHLTIDEATAVLIAIDETLGGYAENSGMEEQYEKLNAIRLRLRESRARAAFNRLGEGRDE